MQSSCKGGWGVQCRKSLKVTRPKWMRGQTWQCALSGFLLDSSVEHALHSSALPILNSVQIPRALGKVVSMLLHVPPCSSQITVIALLSSQEAPAAPLLTCSAPPARWVALAFSAFPPSVCLPNSLLSRLLGQSRSSVTHLPLMGTDEAFFLPVLPGLHLIKVLIMLSGIHLSLLSHQTGRSSRAVSFS